MAKIKHNNFLDTVSDIFANAKQNGVLHLYTEGRSLSGRKIQIKGKELLHFGTTGYLGLEQDPRLKEAASQAIWDFGTQFPLSKSHISHPLYQELEENLEKMYGHSTIVTKNSTLGHISVIPTLIRDEDAAILDHQVHWSVQNACQMLKLRGIPVKMIRHNNLQMLEDTIKGLQNKCRNIWYMADGIYSMYGDYAPMDELMALTVKYPQLHLYFDDVHGMSWTGAHGTGYVMSQLRSLPEKVVLFGTLSKTFGASGSMFVTADKDLNEKVKNFGGPLTFSAQLEPASVAAAIASTQIHLSDEIYGLQNELATRIAHCNALIANTSLPLVETNNSPVFYIGTGTPCIGYQFVNALMDEGFYVNFVPYPAVPVKNTGIRFTISRHNQLEDIEALVQAMEYHYPRVLENGGSSMNKVRKWFNLPLLDEKIVNVGADGLKLVTYDSIRAVDKQRWNGLMGGNSAYDWDGLLFLESAFSNNEREEDNWKFRYVMIEDETQEVVLCTFLTSSLWKEDMLASVSVSQQLEEQRKLDPYYLCSKVLMMGSLFTEGSHLHLDREHKSWKESLSMLFDELDRLESLDDCETIVLRDFPEVDEELLDLFHQKSFFKVDMPDSCQIESLDWEDEEGYVAQLTSKSRKHFRKDIKPFEANYNITYKSQLNEDEINYAWQLYENVRMNNLELNTFPFPKKVFFEMNGSGQWEFMLLHLKPSVEPDVDLTKPVGVMFCYQNEETFVPAFIGMDYNFSRKYNLYRMMLFQTVMRAKEVGCSKVDFGLSAAFEKKKVGATISPRIAFVQARDNYNMELMGTMQNDKAK